MKKLILIIAAILFFFESFSQQTNPAPSLSKQDYLTKSKKQKTGAWGLLGFGAAMLVGGTIIAASETEDRWNEGEGESLDAAGVVAAIGVTAMVGSIPLFIASSRNKRKAMSVSLKNEQFQSLKNSSLVYKPMPAVSLKINL
jgi:hypothetical protein